MSSPKRPMNLFALILLLLGSFFALFLIISGLLFISRTDPRGTGGGSPFSSGKVGIIEISGEISDSKKILAALDRFEDENSIKAVVLRINSPGGATAPSQEIYEAVRKYKKPVVASLSSIAASGAYYIACGTKKIFANPGTLTGSIGVIMQFTDLKGLYSWAKVQRFAIKSGKYKDIGSEYREMTSEERNLMQKVVDDVLLQFKKAVAEGRHLSLAQVSAVADGRIFSGNQAKEAHLVDELGTLKDAIDEAGKLGQIQGKPGIVTIEKKKKGLLDFMFGDTGADGMDSSAAGHRNFERLLLLLEKSMSPSNDSVSASPGLSLLWQGSPRLESRFPE